MKIKRLKSGTIKMTARGKADSNALLKLLGQKFTKYKCPNCKCDVETLQPTEMLVSNKGYWDGVKVCPNCSSESFVIVWPTGETEVYGKP